MLVMLVSLAAAAAVGLWWYDERAAPATGRLLVPLRARPPIGPPRPPR